MARTTERGQVIVETAISVGLVVVMVLAFVAIIMTSHEAGRRFEFKTHRRSEYGAEIQALERTIRTLDGQQR